MNVNCQLIASTMAKTECIQLGLTDEEAEALLSVDVRARRGSSSLDYLGGLPVDAGILERFDLGKHATRRHQWCGRWVNNRALTAPAAMVAVKAATILGRADDDDLFSSAAIYRDSQYLSCGPQVWSWSKYRASEHLSCRGVTGLPVT